MGNAELYVLDTHPTPEGQDVFNSGDDPFPGRETEALGAKYLEIHPKSVCICAGLPSSEREGLGSGGTGRAQPPSNADLTSGWGNQVEHITKITK